MHPKKTPGIFLVIVSRLCTRVYSKFFQFYFVLLNRVVKHAYKFDSYNIEMCIVGSFFISESKKEKEESSIFLFFNIYIFLFFSHLSCFIKFYQLFRVLSPKNFCSFLVIIVIMIIIVIIIFIIILLLKQNKIFQFAFFFFFLLVLRFE